MSRPLFLTLEEFAREINLSPIGVLQYEVIGVLTPHHFGPDEDRLYSWLLVEYFKPRG